MTQVRVTQVLMAGGRGHEHIAQLYWIDLGLPQRRGWASRQQMVDFVDTPGNTAYVANGDARVIIRSVHPLPTTLLFSSVRLPYVQTRRDGTPTDNLLYLPGGPMHGY